MDSSRPIGLGRQSVLLFYGTGHRRTIDKFINLFVLFGPSFFLLMRREPRTFQSSKISSRAPFSLPKRQIVCARGPGRRTHTQKTSRVDQTIIHQTQEWLDDKTHGGGGGGTSIERRF